MRRGKIPQEAVIGIVYAVSAAAGVLAIDRAPHGAEHLKDLLVGSILWVTWPHVLKTAGIYTLVGLFHWIFRDRFLTISFAEEDAVRRGWLLGLRGSTTEQLQALAGRWWAVGSMCTRSLRQRESCCCGTRSP